MFPSKIFQSYGDVTIYYERLHTVRLFSALIAFKQGGIFIVPHQLCHGTSGITVTPEGPPRFVALYDK